MSNNDAESPGAQDPDSPESDTFSLDSGAGKTIVVYGRTFQEDALDQGSLHTPVDEEEKERQDDLHKAYQMIFDDKLIFPPIENPTKILDCGYCTGAWAIAVAEKYPNAEVHGLDVTHLLKTEFTPPNLHLYVDDLNRPINYDRDTFDLVRSQNLCTGIRKDRWPGYVRDCTRILKPGGWLQFCELYLNIQSDNGSITPQHAVYQLNESFKQALDKNRDRHAPRNMERMMHDAGLVELESKVINIPMNEWPTDPDQRKWGETFGPLIRAGIGGQVMVPFTDCLGMPWNQAQVLIATCRNDLEKTELKPYIALYVNIGRKPNS